jgi:hypothetical protein
MLEGVALLRWENNEIGSRTEVELSGKVLAWHGCLPNIAREQTNKG